MSEPIVSDKKFCERLRRQADDGHHWDRAPAMLRESAERIERLTRELEEERELHLTARGQSDAYEMGMESWKAGCERLTRELEAMEDARDIAQAEGALMEMDRDRLRAALERYGGHEDDCAGMAGHLDPRCTCGFTAAQEPKP